MKCPLLLGLVTNAHYQSLLPDSISTNHEGLRDVTEKLIGDRHIVGTRKRKLFTATSVLVGLAIIVALIVASVPGKFIKIIFLQ